MFRQGSGQASNPRPPRTWQARVGSSTASSSPADTNHRCRVYRVHDKATQPDWPDLLGKDTIDEMATAMATSDVLVAGDLEAPVLQGVERPGHQRVDVVHEVRQLPFHIGQQHVDVEGPAGSGLGLDQGKGNVDQKIVGLCLNLLFAMSGCGEGSNPIQASKTNSAPLPASIDERSEAIGPDENATRRSDARTAAERLLLFSNHDIILRVSGCADIKSTCDLGAPVRDAAGRCYLLLTIQEADIPKGLPTWARQGDAMWISSGVDGVYLTADDHMVEATGVRQCKGAIGEVRRRLAESPRDSFPELLRNPELGEGEGSLSGGPWPSENDAS
jgi:hypothetical protein